jgi:hypothetical protein
MIYKGTSVSLWLVLGFGLLLGLALIYWIIAALLYALPFLGALLWYLWWLDNGKSGAARVLGGRSPESPAGRLSR